MIGVGSKTLHSVSEMSGPIGTFADGLLVCFVLITLLTCTNVVQLGKSIAFVEGKLSDENKKMIATATATLKMSLNKKVS